MFLSGFALSRKHQPAHGPGWRRRAEDGAAGAMTRSAKPGGDRTAKANAAFAARANARAAKVAPIIAEIRATGGVWHCTGTQCAWHSDRQREKEMGGRAGAPGNWHGSSRAVAG
jgi:hypothetical protein